MTRKNCETREIKKQFNEKSNKNIKQTQSCVFASACNESMIKRFLKAIYK